MARKSSAKKRRNKAAVAKSPRREDSPARASPAGALSPAHADAWSTPHNLLALLALCALVAISFFPATMAGFVWDDSVLTQAEPVKRLSGLWDIWFAPRNIENEAHYWPVLYTTFWLEYQLWELEPRGYHIVSLLLHLGVALMLWRLLVRLGMPGAWAWLVAAVFAVHPTHVESAAWVIGRKDLLSSLFYIGCALAWIRFTEDGRRAHYGLALLLFVLSLLSKAIAITLPVSLLIWHWWKRGRVTGVDVARIAPLLLVGLAIIITDWFYYDSIEAMSFDYTLLERVLMASQSLWFYALNLLWPSQLAVIYPHWDIGATNPLAWAALLGALAVVAGLWVARHRIGRAPLAAVLFFAVTLTPVLGLVEYGYMRYSFVADRYQYLASAGIIALVVGAAAHGVSRLAGAWQTGAVGAAPALAAAPAVAVLAVLGTLTWQQSGIYRDSITFYEHITSVNPDAGHAHSNLGLAYQREGRNEEALASCRLSLEQALNHPTDKGWNGWVQMCLGEALSELGRLEEAEQHYRRAVEIRPQFVPGLAYLGAFLVNKGFQPEEALGIFQDLSRRKPNNPDYHAGTAAALGNLGRLEEALQSFERAIALAPDLENLKASRDQVLRDIQRREGGQSE